MIPRKKFYRKDEQLNAVEKHLIWRNIKKEISLGENSGKRFHWSSFSLGMAAAVILMFAFMGMQSFFVSQNNERLPEIIRVNRAYESALNNFEALIPQNVKTAGYEIDLDETLSTKLEKISVLDDAIKEINSASIKDYSTVRQRRLTELYQMKLKTIEEIIDLEESTK